MRLHGLRRGSFLLQARIISHGSEAGAPFSTSIRRTIDDLFSLVPSLEAARTRKTRFTTGSRNREASHSSGNAKQAKAQTAGASHGQDSGSPAGRTTINSGNQGSTLSRTPNVSLRLAAEATEAGLASMPSNGSSPLLGLNDETEVGIREELPKVFSLSTKSAVENMPKLHEREAMESMVYKEISPCLHHIRLGEPDYFLLWPALNEILPEDVLNPTIRTPRGTLRYHQHIGDSRYGTTTANNRLAIHHAMGLIQFPVQPTQLLEEGTDQRFLPGPASNWPHRLWASGGLTIYTKLPPRFLHSPTATIHVLEQPTKLRIHGHGESAKSFVTVLRKWFFFDRATRGHTSYTVPGVLKRFESQPTYFPNGDLNPDSVPAMVEEYTLLFLRQSPNLSQADRRTVRSPTGPQYQHHLQISRHLLFCWSAITQNAHLIHLDQAYAKSLGAPDLVVQGPLTAFIALEWTQRMLNRLARERELNYFFISDVTYKCVQPIFIDEALTLNMRTQGQRKPGTLDEVWDIWIESAPSSGEATLLFKAEVRLSLRELPVQEEWFKEGSPSRATFS